MYFGKYCKVVRTYLRPIFPKLSFGRVKSQNFVKNGLLYNLFSRILRLLMEAPTCHNMVLIYFLVIRIHIGKMYFLLFLSLNSKTCRQ